MFNPGGECIDAVKVIAQGLGIVFHREVEGFLNRKTEFQRIHRIQAKAIVSKKRSVVANISGGDLR